MKGNKREDRSSVDRNEAQQKLGDNENSWEINSKFEGVPLAGHFVNGSPVANRTEKSEDGDDGDDAGQRTSVASRRSLECRKRLLGRLLPCGSF